MTSTIYPSVKIGSRKPNGNRRTATPFASDHAHLLAEATFTVRTDALESYRIRIARLRLTQLQPLSPVGDRCYDWNP